MTESDDQVCFTVGVFQDVEWAERGLDALKRGGFDNTSLSVVCKESQDVKSLLARILEEAPPSIEVDGIGAVFAQGSLVKTLQGSDEGLKNAGIAATISRAGFQAHDGVIFETLTARGGILVAIESESLAADALTVLHSYGGGNAAIGAWRGRV
tara:strand:+ start:1422 stop:1883 length:462 start_codon:yes stop_codon:yes gene_type:complete